MSWLKVNYYVRKHHLLRSRRRCSEVFVSYHHLYRLKRMSDRVGSLCVRTVNWKSDTINFTGFPQTAPNGICVFTSNPSNWFAVEVVHWLFLVWCSILRWFPCQNTFPGRLPWWLELNRVCGSLSLPFILCVLRVVFSGNESEFF